MLGKPPSLSYYLVGVIFFSLCCEGVCSLTIRVLSPMKYFKPAHPLYTTKYNISHHFLSSCSGVQGDQPRGAVVCWGPGEDAGCQGQQEAGEEDQGVADAAVGREEACIPVQGAEWEDQWEDEGHEETAGWGWGRNQQRKGSQKKGKQNH